MAFSITARAATGEPQTEIPPPPVHIPGQPGAWRRYEGLLIGALAVLIFVSIWQFVAWPTHRLMPELFLPGPIDIANAFGAYIAKGQAASSIASKSTCRAHAS